MNEEMEKYPFAFLGEKYYQCPQGIMKERDDGDDITIGKIYLHQIKIKRDIQDRYEPLYSIKYEDFIFKEIKVIKNKTFDELVNFIDKQKLIYEKKSIIEQILLYHIIYNHGLNRGKHLIVKEKVDFKKEDMPLTPI